MKLKTYLTEAKIKNLTRPVVKKINKEVHKIMKKTYFKEIPLQPLFDILKKFNVIVIQEDFTPWSGILTGGVKETEQIYFTLAWNEKDERNFYSQVIPDAKLALSYYKMPSGKYEVISYVT